MTPKELADAATTALNEAETAVDLVTDDSENTMDADAKVAAAKAAVDKVPAAQRAALSQRLGNLEGTLEGKTASRTAAMQRKAAAEKKAMAATGKALFAALDGPLVPGTTTAAAVKNALDNLADAADVQTGLSNSGDPTGIKLDPTDGGGDLPISTEVNDVYVPNESPVVFTTVKPVKKVGDWMVSDQTDGIRTEGQLVPEFTDRARVYNDRGENTKKDAAAHFGSDDKPATTGTYTAKNRSLSLNFAVDPLIASPEFPAAGTKLFAPKNGASEVKVRGTYQGAPGYYYCKTDCQVRVNRGGLSMGNSNGDWRFVHDPGAQVSLTDSSYLYFGWWVRSNSSDDVPRLATAFFGYEGLIDDNTSSARNYNGSATFEGPAVGQYAIHDPRNGEGEGGAFEAKATLKARFGDPDNVRDAGLSGTIDEFRLNGGSEDPGWSVQLMKSGFDQSTGTRVTRRGTKTVMSIGDVKGPEVLNSWEARLFDTTPGTVADGGDGRDEADKVLGTFYSEYSTTHRLVGAFGASNITKQNVND